jgi:hypothetical protein
MKRAALGAILGLLALLAAPGARANCADDLRVLKAKLPEVPDGARRQELALLLEKATKDEQSGRIKLCVDAVTQARILLK